MAATVSLGGPYAIIICFIFPLCMESNALEKSTNNIVSSRFFERTFRIRRIVKICDVVDRFLRKPFWLFLSIFSILCSMQLINDSIGKQDLFWFKKNSNKYRHKTVNLLNMATIFFSMILSTRIRNDFNTFKINSSDILFHSLLIAILSEPIFGWEVAFVLFFFVFWGFFF